MNVFVLDKDPILAASQLCDRHLVMVKETAQILSTALFINGIHPDDIYKPYQPQTRFPRWAALSRLNFEWLVLHGLAIAEENFKRRGKRHKSENIIERCAEFSNLLPDQPLTEFERSEGVQPGDIVEAYRDFYRRDKREFAVWSSPAKVPDWFY